MHVNGPTTAIEDLVYDGSIPTDGNGHINKVNHPTDECYMPP